MMPGIDSIMLHQKKINQLCASLGLRQFKDIEYSFMEEVLTRLAQGLDHLQGQYNHENYMYFLFPTLLQLYSRAH